MRLAFIKLMKNNLEEDYCMLIYEEKVDVNSKIPK